MTEDDNELQDFIDTVNNEAANMITDDAAIPGTTPEPDTGDTTPPPPPLSA